MSTQDTEDRREYYRIEDQIALQIHLHDSNQQQDSILFNLLSELHQLEQDAQPLLRTVSESNRAAAQYLKVTNKRIDVLSQMLVLSVLKDIGPPQTVSLSECGIAFFDETLYPLGSLISLTMISLPHGLAVQLTARVTEHRTVAQGLQTVSMFENLSDAQRQILARHILHQQALQRRLELEAAEQGGK